jgi:hypothetical protein
MSSKPDIHCLTFGGGAEQFRAAARRLARQAAASGFFTAVTAVTDLELLEDEQFRAGHGAFVARNPRGFGYWLWKPYLLLRKLRSVRDGDIVFYCDAGCEINPLGAKIFAEYVSLLRQHELLLFRLPHLNEHWTKGDLLDRYPALSGQRQIMGTVFAVRASDATRAFAQAWYDLCCADDYHYLDDTKSVAPNRPGFMEHRHDQCCLSAVVSRECPSLSILEVGSMMKRKNMIHYPILITRNRTGNRKTLTGSIFNLSFILRIKQGKRPLIALRWRNSTV